MHHTVIDVLIYIFEHYAEDDAELLDDHDKLRMLLREAGVGPGLSPDEQTQAFVQLAAPVDRQAAPPETTGARATLSPQRLTSYLVYHGEYSGLLSARVTESHIVNQPRFVGAVQAVDRLPSQ